jgi:hypothetical protein
VKDSNWVISDDVECDENKEDNDWVTAIGL